MIDAIKGQGSDGLQNTSTVVGNMLNENLPIGQSTSSATISNGHLAGEGAKQETIESSSSAVGTAETSQTATEGGADHLGLKTSE